MISMLAYVRHASSKIKSKDGLVQNRDLYVGVERHVYQWNVVSVSQHFKKKYIERIGLV
jgi:hypothetical protein